MTPLLGTQRLIVIEFPAKSTKIGLLTQVLYKNCLLRHEIQARSKLIELCIYLLCFSLLGNFASDFRLILKQVGFPT